MNEHIGLIVGDYKFDESVDKYSSVWRAHHTGNGDSVIIKRSNPERFSDSTELASRYIEYEHAILSCIAHRGVCEAIKWIKKNDYSWLVLKDYGDTSIANINDINELGPALMKASEGIVYLHDQSIIHGDITPAHIVEGVVVDFDSAFQYSLWEAFGRPILKGATPGYTPPKYDKSKPRNRYDVFGFCRSAFEAFYRIGSISDYSEIEKIIRAGMSDDIENLPTMDEIKNAFANAFS